MVYLGPLWDFGLFIEILILTGHLVIFVISLSVFFAWYSEGQWTNSPRHFPSQFAVVDRQERVFKFARSTQKGCKIQLVRAVSLEFLELELGLG